VDYAAALAGLSAPARPSVFASGNQNDPSALLAAWTSRDNAANLAGYRFAIGSIPGGADLVNWTPTVAAQAALSGLALVAGHTYWISVQAKNEFGLWSFVARDWFIAGQAKVVRVHLPLVSN
jgi:hypothetical protein